MTKTVKSRRKGLCAILLIVACFLVSVTAGAMFSARAASAYNPGTETGWVHIGAKSESEILKALTDKVAEINTSIEAANTASKDLAQAYADGDILIYSTVEGSNGLLTSDNERSGWKVWSSEDSTPLADLKSLNVGPWGDVCAFLSYNAGTDKAYIITDKFADNYTNDGKKLGVAMSDAFKVGEVKYQNFSGGYMKLEGNNVSVEFGKNVEIVGGGSSINLIDVDPTESGFVGAMNDSMITATGDSAQVIYDAFVSAYNDSKTAGFNVGYPFVSIKHSQGIYLQDFRNGDSVSDPYGDGNRTKWAAIAYNAELAELIRIIISRERTCRFIS